MKLLIESDNISSHSEAAVYYAKEIELDHLENKMIDYLLRYGFHSGLNYNEEISIYTAREVARGLINKVILNDKYEFVYLKEREV